jgi:hypothetical protein
MKQAWSFVLVLLIGCAVTSASDFATAVAEATFRISNLDQAGACFLVRGEAPDSSLYVVTAAHVLEAFEKSPATIRLRERRADRSYQRADYTIALRRGDKRLWVRDAAEDVGVLRLSEPVPVPVAALPFSALADEGRFSAASLHLCSLVFLLTEGSGSRLNN